MAGDLIGVTAGADRVNADAQGSTWRSYLGVRFGSWLAPIGVVGALALAAATFDSVGSPWP
jgi:hypothetical protein